MIYTLFGTPVKITNVSRKTGILTVSSRSPANEHDNYEWHRYPCELRADGGIEEIDAAVKVFLDKNKTQGLCIVQDSLKDVDKLIKSLYPCFPIGSVEERVITRITYAILGVEKLIGREQKSEKKE